MTDVVPAVVLVGAANLGRRVGSMQPHQGIQLVLQNYHHIHPPQQLPKHNALIHTLPFAQRVTHIRNFFPVLKGGSLVVAPELGASVEGGPVHQAFSVAQRAPVGGASAKILPDVESERHRQNLLLNGSQVQVHRRLNQPVGQLYKVIYRLHLPGTEHLARGKLGGNDNLGKLLEQGLAIRPQAKEDVRHKDGRQPGNGPPEVNRHHLNFRVCRPVPVVGFKQGGPQPIPQHLLYLAVGGGDDRFFGAGAGRIGH